jgi:photosystem II stability/assembly factor-like uncharacterized protein
MRLASLILGLLVCVAPAWAFLPPAYDDAPVRNIKFINKNHGVAVGDHGVVWQTLDSGKTWDRMKSGTKASLRGLHFLDDITGWTVGRKELPSGLGSVGIVMMTNDGGLTWTEQNTTQLPGLNVVQFFSETHGVAAGDGTAECPSGFFATEDAGKTWMPVRGPRTTSWLCGEFADQSNGVLGGVWGQCSSVVQGKFQPVEMPSIQAISGNIAVGECGTVVCNNNGRWTTCDIGVSADAMKNLDFHAVARNGDTVWVAGRPGSIVFKSIDNGKTWTKHKTNWSGTIHAMTASSADEVYAVGDLGVILKSKDGGATWTVQRSGGQRSAVLFAHESYRTLPLDALATLGVRDGYHTVCLTLGSADTKSAQLLHTTDSFRQASAVRQAGGTVSETCSGFPMSGYQREGTVEQLANRWKEDDVVRRLVLAIRQWTPDVVVSDYLSANATPAEQWMLACTKKAFKLAEDPSAYPEQLELGLKVYAPKKLYAIAPTTGNEAQIQVDNTEFSRNLVTTIQGYTDPAFAILGETLTAPAQRRYRLVSHRVPGCEKHTSLSAGFTFAEGGAARRELPKFDISLDELFEKAKTVSAARKSLEGMLGAATTRIETEKALTAVYDQLRKLPEDVACKAAVGVGRSFASQGKWVLAREMYLIVAAKYSGFDDSAEAVRWLQRYYGSAEARLRADRENATVMQYGVAVTTKNNDGTLQPVRYQEPVVSKTEFKMTDAEAIQAWGKASMEMRTKLQSFGEAYDRDPAFHFSTLVARRQLNLSGDASEQLTQYFARRPGAVLAKPGEDLWRDCFAAELWLGNRTAVAVQPKPYSTMTLSTKPHLDGVLDDECWKTATPMELKGDTAGYSTVAKVSMDDEFLYVAVVCKHPEGKHQPKATSRKRDDDLRGMDRVDVMLDLDRDYQTYYRFQIDQRGCVAEDCTGDSSWNPKYFVAVEPTSTGWTAELAIPRSELTNSTFKMGQTWAVNFTRVIPAVGCQTWSGPADSTPRPEASGLLQVVEGKK